MSNLSNTQGEGGSGKPAFGAAFSWHSRRSELARKRRCGRAPREFVDTGYGTHDGQGNVPTGTERMKGTGFDEHGQVKTQFGKFAVAYDPVTGMAVDNVTAGYSFPAGGESGGGGGLVDVSAQAPAAGTHATRQMQEDVQRFFEARAATQQPPQERQEDGEGGGSGQEIGERLDAGEYLPSEPTRTGHEAEAWRRHGPPTEEEGS